MKKKFAVLYVLITSLCLLTSVFVVFHVLGYRVNRSSSLPGSVYRITPLEGDESLVTGDIVLIDLSKISNPVIDRGMERGYVSKSWNQPMLKRIGALPGDSVALKDGYLIVNGEAAAKMTVASRDSFGGELVPWPTPIVLQPNHYWLTSEPERGFDSRYFGPIDRNAFTHKANAVF
ncbi:MAG: S26 family signal peptidase [Synergistaceae bacterium]|nr:S26 family signal peptidase [Synergistaceae bacterium]